jgi:phosphate transport system substrate-binding protein
LTISAGDGPAYAPTLENATQGRYPLARFLFIYTAGEPTGPGKRYLEYVLSEPGQSVVEGAGYYPLPRDAVTPRRPLDLPSSNPE